MAYRYEFDDAVAGDLHFDRGRYELLQGGLRALRDELRAWNERARDHGAVGEPYEAEVADLNRMIEWGDERLAHSDVSEITVQRMSVGSLRYAKAALLLNIRRREENRQQRAEQGWPDAVLHSIDAGTDRLRRLEQEINHLPADVLWQVIPREDNVPCAEERSMEWDVFISHASEDKEEFVRPLAEALRVRGLRVWFDEFTLTVGDSLRRSIDQGLAHSEFGVVVISRNFLKKEWPQRELDGLVAREIEGVKIILPVWHNITAAEIREYSPTLADRLATTSDAGIEKVVADLVRAMGKNGGPQSPAPTAVPVPPEAKIQEWHRTSHARYLGLLKERGQEWPVPVEENHYQLSFEILSGGNTPVISLENVRRNLKEAEEIVRNEVWTGWSMFHLFGRAGIAPYVIVESIGGQEIEMIEACVLGEAHSSTTVPDFWRISTTGAGTLVRPYREDRQLVEFGGERLEPGTYLAPRILVRELYEFVCFARELFGTFPSAARVNFLCTWWGLEGRKINDARPGIQWHERTSHSNTRTTSATTDIEQLNEEISQLVATLVNPVLHLFDGLEIEAGWIESEKSTFRVI